MNHTQTTNKVIETDYLIVGGGAMGAAFADEMINNDSKSTIVIVDKNERLGGHWVHAYPYVRLHQPAQFYGVNSLRLGNNSTDLSSKPEILAYYDKVLQNLLLTGRVTFLGKHSYIGNNQVAPIDNPDEVISIKIKKKLVDATYMKVEVPSTHPPRFQVDEGVNFVPLNNVVTEYEKWERFYILGAGKSGMDAVYYLVKQGVDPDKIHWIISNDVWCWNRDKIQCDTVVPFLFELGYKQLEADKIEDIFLKMEKSDGWLRIDEQVMPTRWRGPTINKHELETMRRVKNRIRKGRVARITPTEIHFKDEKLAYAEGSLFVDCTSCGLAPRPEKTIMSEKVITLQPVIFMQQVFSAAIIAKYEASGMSDKVNNLNIILHPQFPKDWPMIYNNTISNLLKLNLDLPLWMATSRLNLMTHDGKFNYVKSGIEALFLARKLKKTPIPT